MQLLVEPISYNHALECIKQGVDIILIGHDKFASRIVHSFSLEEIQSLLKVKQKTKIWIKINAFFFEHDLKELKSYLTEISELSVDMVVFQDYAVNQINHDHNLKLNLHYNPETLVTSYGQFDFFKEYDIKGCFLARELLLNEVLEIAKNKQDMVVEIQGFGYGMIMHSRWKIITNFETFYKTNIRENDDHVLIRENLRKVPNIIYEDNHGTHMLTGYIISALKVLEKINSLVDILSLSFVSIKNVDANAVTNLFFEAIKAVKNNTYNVSEYIDKLQILLENKLISAGFLGGPKDILHMLKEENE